MELETFPHRLSEAMKRHRTYEFQPNWFEYVSALGASLLVEVTGSLFRGSGEKRLPAQTLEYLVSCLTVCKTNNPHDTVYSLLSLAKDAIPRSGMARTSYDPNDITNEAIPRGASLVCQALPR